MKISVLIVGLVVALVGGLIYYVASADYTIPFFFWDLPIPNPLSFLGPYALLVLGVGVVLFLAGLFWRRGGD